MTDLVERLDCLHVWPQSVADHYADTLTPRQIKELYAVGDVATAAKDCIEQLKAEIARKDALMEKVAQAERDAVVKWLRDRDGFNDFYSELQGKWLSERIEAREHLTQPST